MKLLKYIAFLSISLLSVYFSLELIYWFCKKAYYANFFVALLYLVVLTLVVLGVTKVLFYLLAIIRGTLDTGGKYGILVMFILVVIVFLVAFRNFHVAFKVNSFKDFLIAAMFYIQSWRLSQAYYLQLSFKDE